ncbi:TorF family putative porin [Shewanella colwelliana]|uniref:TorF family putative porin n=1 Tax=Shewanella colwelliana TaxID=23 RepID=UPI0022AF8503|nr:TorF family putative porin [Shewanella colwelliana]MCZ4336130.1 TorF family putative porin [Shewanella colwelliana]
MYKKFNKKRIAQVVGLTLATALMAPIAQAEVSGEIGVTNDYRFRGVSQTAGDFAVQAGIDYSMESGFFVGAWASNVDDESYDSNVEVDIYAGYAGAFGEDDAVEYDVTLTYYTYPGQDESSRYLEATVGFYVADFHFAQWYTNNYANADVSTHYSELNYSYEIAENWSIDAHVGYSYGDGADLDWGENYVDYSIGVSTEVGGVGLSVAWLDTNLSSDNNISSGAWKNSGTVLATASYAF